MNTFSKVSLLVALVAISGFAVAMTHHARIIEGATPAAPGEICPVCREYIGPDEIVESGADYCGCDPMHLAHQRCMANWMTDQSTCPMCDRYRRDLIDLPINVSNALYVLNNDARALGCSHNFFSPTMSEREFGQGGMRVRELLKEDERSEFELAFHILNLWIIENPGRYLREPRAWMCAPLPEGRRYAPGILMGEHVRARLLPGAIEYLSDYRRPRG